MKREKKGKKCGQTFAEMRVYKRIVPIFQRWEVLGGKLGVETFFMVEE